ncbi:transcription factor bHLH96, partial [Trifolium medium]|nr:transcription factor bHLH96 [Trifolium medium]
VQVPDVWRWQPDPVRSYSVSGAYQLLTSQQSVTLEAADELVWHKQVPLK